MKDSVQMETILVCGTEGGSLRILGKKEPNGRWKFLAKRDETTLNEYLNEEDQFPRDSLREESAFVCSIDDALLLLDKYPWYRFTIMKIHPDFEECIRKEIEKRCERNGVTPPL